MKKYKELLLETLNYGLLVCGLIWTYLWVKDNKSAALPLPSQITTGTGGLSCTFTSTVWMVFVPPSITRQTSGIVWWFCKVTKIIEINFWLIQNFV